MDQPAKIRELYEEVESEREVSRRLGISRRQVRLALGRNPDGPESDSASVRSGSARPMLPSGDDVIREQRPDGSERISYTGRVTSLEDLKLRCEIDEEIFDVPKARVKSYEGYIKGPDGEFTVEQLFSVTADLVKREDVLELQRLKDEVLAAMAAHAPLYTKRAYPKLSGEKYALEVAPVDLHLGKLAWGPEVNGQHYDTDLASAVLRQAIDDLLARTQGYALERIFLVAGNDFLNTDGPDNETTQGTPQDTDSRHAKVFRRGWRLMVEVIDRLQEVAPVTVKMVPGNHDEDASFKLGEVLWAWYRNCPNVEIDNQPRLRKFFEYGPALVMLTHGKEEKLQSLPLVMANEAPEAWGRTRHHEVHIGHFHKRAAFGFVGGDTIDGVVVRVLPSLCNTDEFHYRHGWPSTDRAMESYLWGEHSGYAGHLSISARPVEGEESDEEDAA